MKKTNELIKLVMEDSSFENPEEVPVVELIDLLRSKRCYNQLNFLSRNDKDTRDFIVSTVNKNATIENDFRMAFLILILSDSECSREAFDLSRRLVKDPDLSRTKKLTMNVLLREYMYGNKH